MDVHFVKIRQRIVIDRNKEDVWDYTQNFSNRPEWDRSVKAVDIVQKNPTQVKLVFKNDSNITLEYQMENRPNKATLTIRKSESRIIQTGSGTSSFEERSGTTLWTETVTYVMKRKPLMGLLLPWYNLLFSIKLRSAMHRAKSILERGENRPQEQDDLSAASATEWVTAEAGQERAAED